MDLETYKNSIPIVVISYNNHYYVRNMIQQLSKYNQLHNTIILDNNSDCQETLDYLNSNHGVRVIRNDTNRGPWIRPGVNDHIYNQLPEHFILTDADLQFHPELPLDFIPRLYDLIEKYPCRKMGLAL